MSNRYIFIFLAASILATSSTCTKNAEPETPAVDPEENAELAPLTSKVSVNQDWVFESRPEIIIHVENPNAKAVEAAATAKITTDKGAAVTSVELAVEVAGNGSEDIVLTTPDELPAGYYKANCRINNSRISNYLVLIHSPFNNSINV